MNAFRMGPSIVVFGIALAIPSAAWMTAQAPAKPPVAKIDPKATTLHGETLIDNYYWLRDKANPEVKAHLEAENAYTAAGMKHTEALQETLYRECSAASKSRTAQCRISRRLLVLHANGEGKAYPIYCRKRGTLEAGEEVILDQNALAEGKKFHALGGFDVSPDGSKLLYLEDFTAFREYTLYVKDLATAKIVESIPKVWNGTAWASDNRTFFYMTADEAKRGNAVWRHVIGTPREQDVKVFQEDNVLNNVSVLRSRSEKFIFIPADGFTSSEWRVIPAANPTAAPRVIAARRPNVEYSVEHGGEFFYIHTNDNARNFKIVRAPDSDGTPASWKDWVAHRPEAFVEGVDVFRSFGVVAERRDGLRHCALSSWARIAATT